MSLFQDLATYKLIDKWVPLLDWLLSSKRFSNEKKWNTKMRCSFTKKLKKLPGVGKENWTIQPIKATNWKVDTAKRVHIIMNSDNSEGESLIRHIRNGIAHGEVKIVKCPEGLYLDICDYQSDAHTKQTAHIWMPIDMLFDVYEIYTKIEKAANQQKKGKTI